MKEIKKKIDLKEKNYRQKKPIHLKEENYRKKKKPEIFF
jgi:hypothetical protein